MKTYRLLINPFAEIDLKVAKEWYLLQKDRFAHEFIDEVDVQLKRICKNPFQFPIERRKIRKAVVQRFPFNIYFLIQGSLINVFAVFHNSRNPIVWRNRLP